MNGLEGEGEGDGGGESGRGGDGPTPSVTQLLPRGRSQRPLKAPLEHAQARQDPRLHCTHRGASRGLAVKPGAALPPPLDTARPGSSGTAARWVEGVQGHHPALPAPSAGLILRVHSGVSELLPGRPSPTHKPLGPHLTPATKEDSATGRNPGSPSSQEGPGRSPHRHPEDGRGHSKEWVLGTPHPRAPLCRLQE